MAEIDNPPPPRSRRDQRLAEALRANLKRRKAQSRGRAAPDAGGPQEQAQGAADRSGDQSPASRLGNDE